MGHGRHIGRVGALAVALGVGVGIAASMSSASADTGTESTAPHRGVAVSKRTAQKLTSAPTSQLRTSTPKPVPSAPGQAVLLPSVLGAARPTPRASATTSRASMDQILRYTFFNARPTANPVQTGQTLDGVITGNLNAASPTGAPLTYRVIPDPTGNRTAVVGADGGFTFTDALYTQPGLSHTAGTDTFGVVIDSGSAYRLTGAAGAVQRLFHSVAQMFGLARPDTTTVYVTVKFETLDRLPSITDVTVGSPDATTAVVTGSVTASDPDYDSLAYSISAGPAKGTVTINANTGVFSYTPTLSSRQKAGAAGSSAADKLDTFTVTVTDGYGGTAGTTVAVNILPAAQPAPTLSQKVGTFVAKWKGTQIGDGECVTLIKQYVSEVFGITPGAWGNAINYAQGAGTGGQQLAANGFTWHTDRNFQDGDIIVWHSWLYDTSVGKVVDYGHVGVYDQKQIFDARDARHKSTGDPEGRKANFSGAFWPSNGVAGASGSSQYIGYWRKP
jgi:VCBS repeat-containing protein